MNIPTKNYQLLIFALIASSLPSISNAQHEVEEIKVIATPMDRSVAELAQSVTVLGGEELQRVQATSLGETLAGELGLSASSFGAGASRPVIRGLAGARVKMMEDGIDSLDVSTVSVDHAVGIDPLVAEQIEIFRGPTTLLYGSGAVGGVVNTVTRRIPEDVPAEGLEGAVELRADTVANDRTAAVRLDGGQNAFAWHFDLIDRDAGNYSIPGSADVRVPEDSSTRGLMENSSLQITNGSVGGSWLGDNGFFGAALSAFDTNYGVPGAEEELVRIDLQQSRLDLKGGWIDLPGPLDALNVRIGLNDYQHQELEGGETGTLFESQAHEGRVELLHEPWKEWDGVFGIQFGQREFSAIGDEAFIPPVDTTNLGLFVLEQREFELWSLSVGGRLERQEHQPSAVSPKVSGSATSISLAGIRRLGNDYSLAVHLAVADRLPVAEELYANGPHLASGAFEVGDASLHRETSRHVDVGFRKTDGPLTWTVTAFYTSFSDFIFLRETGLIDPIFTLPIFAYSQQDANVTGLETELFTPVANVGMGELDLRIFADYVEGERHSGESLPRLPPLRVGARLQYHDEKLAIGLESSRYADQDDTAAFETPTSGYTMVNADLNWKLPVSLGLDLSVFFRGTNLLDKDARRHTSLVKDIAPLPGRNFLLGIRAEF
jgi:iron complex outermembrane recepter protein